jgi:hypothetical protein
MSVVLIQTLLDSFGTGSNSMAHRSAMVNSEIVQRHPAKDWAASRLQVATA